MGNRTGVCTAVLGSMTAALQAEHALSAASLWGTIVKVGSGNARSGCAYGITFPCSQKRSVTEILSESGIRVRHWLNGEGG